MEVGESAQACCATCVVPTLMVHVGVPWALCGQTITQLVPLTVEPLVGWVMSTVSGVVEFETVMFTLAVPVRPVESVIVTVSVLGPSATEVVFHGIEVGESAHACCATWVLPTVMVQVG